MTKELVSRLRRLGNENGVVGSTDSKERCYMRFLEEALEVVTEKTLGHTDDAVLFYLFSRWTHWCCSSLSYEERQQLFLHSVHVMPTSKGKESIDVPVHTDNVLNIFGR